MTLAASNNVPQLLTQLLDEGTIKPEHRRVLVERHQALRTELIARYKGKIWHAPPPERHAILTGQLAVGMSREMKYGLTPEVLTQALHRQQVRRIDAARRDVTAALDGDLPRFEFWVANLHQSMYDHPSLDEQLVSIGDLARELAVLAAHNPKIRSKTLAWLDALRGVLEKIHFRESKAAIKRQLHGILDAMMAELHGGHIAVFDVYDEKNQRKPMTKGDFEQFINDTRFMVTG